VFGCCLLILWIEAVAMCLQLNDPLWMQLVTMGLTQTIAGRAASIAQATQANMHPGLMTFLAVFYDSVAMLITFPVLVYSYRNFFERRFFQKHMKRVFDSAEKGLTRLRQFKIASVFMFVWIPFWMTGVVVGAVLGYLLGLRHWVTILTATLGNVAAVLCWVYAYDRLFGWLGKINRNLSVIVTIVIILALVVGRIVWKIREAAKRNGE